MTDDATKHGPWIAVIGDQVAGFTPQEAIGQAVEHSATSLGLPTPDVRWVGTDALAADGTRLLDGAAGVWCAPGSPYLSLDGAIDGIRWARESGVPFLGTCAGFQHGVIEFARNVLGHDAAHAEYADHGPEAELFIDELLCSLVGQTMHVELVDPGLVAIYGTDQPEERYYCRFGLSPTWRPALHEAGLRVAGVDAADGDVRLMRLDGHHFYLLTLFVPQTSSTAAAPHPLITSYVRAVLAPRSATPA